jgi:hypothetical protein
LDVTIRDVNWHRVPTPKWIATLNDAQGVVARRHVGEGKHSAVDGVDARPGGAAERLEHDVDTTHTAATESKLGHDAENRVALRRAARRELDCQMLRKRLRGIELQGLRLVPASAHRHRPQPVELAGIEA